MKAGNEKAELNVAVQDLDRCITELEIRCHIVPWDRRVSFCLLGRTAGPSAGRVSVMATNITLEPVKDGDELRPTFSLRREQVQALMDEMYRAGVRPSEHGTAGELEATKAHLKDMRALVAIAMDAPELKSAR